MPGSLTTPGRPSACVGAPVRIAFHEEHRVGTRDKAFAAQWLAYALPCRRFADALASACARLGADVDRYSFIARDLHPLLLAGFGRRTFFSIVTHPHIFNPPTPQTVALDHIDFLLQSPTLVLLAETEQHWPQLRALLTSGQVIGPRVHDARIAALCLQHGVRELWSADRDFGWFSELNVVNPLVR